ncbi:CHAT domain-containing protein [Mycena pura]|uniref:CHAT domain-containing protein n=1 Tax=Mycena pura TaxID=153505 RepID=A0AAD6UNX9_9AGAR|nr:CHAT domain-containing protein [Mycena pura]
MTDTIPWRSPNFAESDDEGSNHFAKAHDILKKCKAASNISSLNTAIYLLSCAVYRWLPADPQLPECLDHLATALLSRFGYTWEVEDVSAANAMRHGAHGAADVQKLFPDTELTDYEDDPHDIMCCAITMVNDFHRAVDPMSLGDAVLLYREAISAWGPSHPQQWKAFWKLSQALLMQFHLDADMAQVDEAVSCMRQVQLMQFDRTLCLCVALITGESGKAIEYSRLLEASDILDRQLQSNQIADDWFATAQHHFQRFQQSGDIMAIDSAVTELQGAGGLLSWCDPVKAAVLGHLGHILHTRFKHMHPGNTTDLDTGIQLLRESLDTPIPVHPNWIISVNNLGIALGTRFERLGDLKDLNEMVKLHRVALDLLSPSDHELSPARVMSLSNLGNALKTRFEQLGDQNNLDEMVELHREALELCDFSHPDYSSSLNNLAVSLHTRFKQREDLKDIDEAIALFRQALEHCAPGHPDHGLCLSNIATALKMRYEQLGDPKDLEASIELHRTVLELRHQSHPDRHTSLSNLAGALQIRPTQQEYLDDLNEAVTLHREALALLDPLHTAYKACLNNLANALQARFDLHIQEDPNDIYEAVELHKIALGLYDPPHPERSISLRNLGQALAQEYGHTKFAQTLDDSMSALQEASMYSVSSPHIRFNCARIWAETAIRYGHRSSLAAYCTAIALLPQLAARHLDIKARHQILTIAQGTHLASDAVNCAVDMEQYDTAVELLETGRSVFWTQALHLRNPLHDLEYADPEIASKLRILSKELDMASFRDTTLTRDQKRMIAMEAENSRYRQLDVEWEQLMEIIRRQPGFEDCMQPHRITALKQAARSGQVVILGSGSTTGYVLNIKASHEVQYLQLPEMDPQTLKNMVSSAQALILSNEDPHSNPLLLTESSVPLISNARLFGSRLTGSREGGRSREEVFRALLADLWNRIVRPVFDALHLNKSDNPPRLWWCPTGPFALLPIHAAGIYGENGIDFTALLHEPAYPAGPLKMTAVIQAAVPNSSPLPGTLQELARIKNRVPSQWLTTLGDGTSIQTALHHLQDSSIVHIASHGTQDLKDALDSGLMFSDGRLKLSDIMQPGGNNNGRAKSLAYLSACETAKGDERTPDEAMHLAGALLFAGFQSIVATMWSINDQDAPKVADKFYAYLFRDCDAYDPQPPDLTKSAEALHHAVSELRKTPDRDDVWMMRLGREMNAKKSGSMSQVASDGQVRFGSGSDRFGSGFESQLQCQLIEIESHGWKEYVRDVRGLLQSINKCTKDVKSVQTKIQLSIEWDTQRKLDAEIQKSREMLAAIHAGSGSHSSRPPFVEHSMDASRGAAGVRVDRDP